MELVLKNLTTSAFTEINLNLTENGLYGIIGRNGAGKSTLFATINQEVLKYEGEIALKNGKSKGRVVYVPNLDIFDKNLSANDYIDLLKGEEKKRALDLMVIFQADKFFSKKIRKYSLGMQEILAFILSMSLESDLVIVDELMNGLDNSMREEAFQVLKKMSADKIILLTSHILEEVEKNCDKVYFLSKNSFTEVSDFEEAKKLVLENEVFI